MTDSNISRLYGFAPVVTEESCVLILGSMPGVASLSASGYYAHPYNAFWSIVEDTVGVPRALPYDERISALASCGVALWDVIASCRREGSLDANIDDASVEPADIVGLLESHPNIERVVLNGGAAARLYQRHIVPALPKQAPPWTKAPSTSPAHASITYEQKRALWWRAFGGTRGGLAGPLLTPPPLSA